MAPPGFAGPLGYLAPVTASSVGAASGTAGRPAGGADTRSSRASWAGLYLTVLTVFPTTGLFQQRPLTFRGPSADYGRGVGATA